MSAISKNKILIFIVILYIIIIAYTFSFIKNYYDELLLFKELKNSLLTLCIVSVLVINYLKKATITNKLEKRVLFLNKFNLILSIIFFSLSIHKITILGFSPNRQILFWQISTIILGLIASAISLIPVYKSNLVVLKK